MMSRFGSGSASSVDMVLSSSFSGRYNVKIDKQSVKNKEEVSFNDGPTRVFYLCDNALNAK